MHSVSSHNDLFYDAQLRSRVIGFLAARHLLTNQAVDITVDAAVVRLRGWVNTRQQLETLVSASRRVAGVSRVDSSQVSVASHPVGRSSLLARAYRGSLIPRSRRAAVLELAS